MHLETSRPFCRITLSKIKTTYEVKFSSLSQSKTLKLNQFSIDKIQKFIEERTSNAWIIAKKDCKVCRDTFMHVLKSLNHA